MHLPKRSYARFPCSLKASVRTPGRRDALPAALRDLGMGGALLSLRISIEDREIEVELPSDDGPLSVRSIITRRLGRDPKAPGLWLYGVEFLPHFSERHKLLKIVDRVRR